MSKMKLLSLFSGIGAFEKALDNIGVGYELVNYCEIDKYASQSYAMIHGCNEEKNLEDITKVNTSELPDDIDMVTYGFPCQDISNAGKMKGFGEDGDRTRSGLFFEALRIIEDKQPRVAICENVKNLTSKRFENEFKIVLESLEEAGYNNYWKVLNAKDFGIPQNRERVFIVSIRKDVDKGAMIFPEAMELKVRLKDFLDEEVEEKYYLTEAGMNCLIRRNEENEKAGRGYRANFEDGSGIAKTLLGRYGKDGKECLIKVREATKKGYAEAHEGDSINLEHPNSKTRRGRVGKSTAQTLTTSCNQGVVVPCSTRGKRYEGVIDEEYRVRKLTPKECFRLMGFTDEDFERIKGISNTQLYKQAGNSIVVRVLEYLLQNVVNAVDWGENTETVIETKGKLLIVKFKGVASWEAMDEMYKRVSEQVKSGVLVIDDKVEYEVI